MKNLKWFSDNFSTIAAQPLPQSHETTRKQKVDDDVEYEIENDEDAGNENLDEFFKFVEKWRTNRVAGNKKIDDIFKSSSCKYLIASHQVDKLCKFATH
jgi:hypothetical protein